MLQFEADRRAFIITVNSFGTDLSSADRSALYPSCGKLYPGGLKLLAQAEDYEQVKAVADCYPVSLTSCPFRCCTVVIAHNLSQTCGQCKLKLRCRTIKWFLMTLSPDQILRLLKTDSSNKR